MTVPELIRAHAAAAPDRPALVTWDGGRRRSLTYAQLDAATDRIAGALRAAGVGRGERIAMVLDNGDAGAFYRLVYGAYKAAAVPVPVNTRLMPAEIDHIVADAGARMVVRDAAEVDALEAAGGPVPDAPGPDDPADLLYTSGTTGLPKGSSFRHRSLALNAERLAKVLRLTSTDVFQTPAPVYTSTGTHTFPLPVLGAGATFVVEPAFDVEASARRLEEERTTVFFGVPAMLMLLLDRLPPDRPLPQLQSLMYGGSPMPEPVIPRLLERFEGAGLWNLYGLTEGGPTGCVLEPEFAIDRAGTVGRPVPGTEMKIVDHAGVEVPRGVPGEIILRSETVMDGYHNAPEATSAALVDGWLHTGDVGSMDADGFVSILDRKKDMIIRGGFNVYPAEIERVLHDHPDVAEAAVVGVPHAILGEDACAVVSLREGSAAGVSELEAFCAERLADFKRPRRWEIVDALPRSAMGKVLKRELRERYAAVAR